MLRIEMKTRRVGVSFRRFAAGAVLAWAFFAVATTFSLAPVAFAPPALAQSPEPKPSAYAPAKNLVAEFDILLEQIEQDLQDKEVYGDYQQDRVEKNANTLAVIALVLGMHDQPSEMKPAASRVISAAVELGGAAEDFGQASAALRELQQARQASKAGGPIKWQAIGDLQQLMKQVPILNNSLRRGVTGRRFRRSIDKSAALAATLAAIAQTARFDTAYCEDEAAKIKWAERCLEMRDASARVGDALRKADQSAAEAALTSLVKTCDNCHHEFRD